MSQIHQLYRLQETDNEIRDKKQRLREVLRLQKENEALRTARQRAEETSASLAAARKRQKDLESELSQLSSKAKRSEERLYSGKVKNPKELSDLELEVAALGRRRSVLEDEILEVMLLVEEAQEAHAQASERLQEVEATWAEQLDALANEQERLAVRLNDLLAARQEQVKQIDAKWLSAYDTMASQRAGVAVARLKNELCQVCGVRSPGSKVRDAQAGELVYCSSCGRILASI